MFQTTIENMKDISITEKDTLIIVDMQNDFLKDGVLEIKDGNDIIGDIHNLIDLFTKREARIVATRDYHPIDHPSFNVFPPHCVQDTKGALIEKSIADKLKSVRRVTNVNIVYKGIFNKESFGAFQYNKEYGDKRGISDNLQLTGSFSLHGSERLEDIIKRDSTLYICGLALDYCVIDTAITAKINEYKDVYIIYDVTKPVCEDMTEIKESIDKYGIKLISVNDIIQSKNSVIVSNHS
jgi:nicotinamidase/pyrazinamidase